MVSPSTGEGGGGGNGGMDASGSLFEGMVLFFSPPDLSSANSPSPPPSAAAEAASSQPLDEDLFSDLIIQAPVYPEPSADPPAISIVPTSAASEEVPAASSLPLHRQPSRKKKRALRIGYGRDSTAFSDDPPHQHHPSDVPMPPPSSVVSQPQPSSYSSSAASDEEVTRTGGEAAEAQPPSVPDNHHADANSGVEIVKEPHRSLEEITSHADKREERGPNAEDEVDSSTGGDSGDSIEDPSGSMESRLELVKARISQKLDSLLQKAASVSVERKELERNRREAAENLSLAVSKYKDMEKELEQACETEDFETAEKVSESLAAVEQDKEKLLIALRNAELDWESTESKMQEILESQIAAEEEGASLLEQLAKDAAEHAALVLKSSEEVSIKELEQWETSVELLEIKQLEMDIESQLISDAQSGMESVIESLVENERKEKEMLTTKEQNLAKELDDLLKLVRLKEVEIAENNSKIQDVDKRISTVVSDFHEARLDIDMKQNKVQTAILKAESEKEALFIKKKEIKESVGSAEEKRRKLMAHAAASVDEAKTFRDLIHLQKCLASLFLKLRDDRVRFAKTEENISQEIQILKQDISAARTTLQELSSTRASVQQELASHKQRINFIEKRSPELEAEKKVAAVSRNFKEAARIAGEAKALNIEKEELLLKKETAVLELEGLEKKITENVQRIQESEELVVLKEKEAALAGCKRLLLMAAGARAERSSALKMGDLEEGAILLKEAEDAESKARELQEVYKVEMEVDIKNYASLAFIINLSGKDLIEMASSFDLPDANGA